MLRRKCRSRKRGPEPKIAKVERREASVPDRKGARAPRKRPACHGFGTPGVPRKHPLVSRRSAPPHRGADGRNETTRAQEMRRGNEQGCARDAREEA